MLFCLQENITWEMINEFCPKKQLDHYQKTLVSKNIIFNYNYVGIILTQIKHAIKFWNKLTFIFSTIAFKLPLYLYACSVFWKFGVRLGLLLSFSGNLKFSFDSVFLQADFRNVVQTRLGSWDDYICDKIEEVVAGLGTVDLQDIRAFQSQILQTYRQIRQEIEEIVAKYEERLLRTLKKTAAERMRLANNNNDSRWLEFIFMNNCLLQIFPENGVMFFINFFKKYLDYLLTVSLWMFPHWR